MQLYSEELSLVLALLKNCMKMLNETRNWYFCVTPENQWQFLSQEKILKSTATKEVIVCFYNLGRENF